MVLSVSREVPSSHVHIALWRRKGKEPGHSPKRRVEIVEGVDCWGFGREVEVKEGSERAENGECPCM